MPPASLAPRHFHRTRAAARTFAQLGLSRLTSLEPEVVGRRYEWAAPGQLVHLDTKKLGRIGNVGHRITGDRRRRARGLGWEFVHVGMSVVPEPQLIPG